MQALTGLKVLVTRPQHQAAELADAIESEGGSAVLFPTLEIVPIPPEDPSLSNFAKDAAVDIAIYITANAVCYSVALWRPSSSTQVAAMGEATRDALSGHGIHTEITPIGQYRTEGLLAHPALQDLKQQRVLIFTGNDGRSLLKDELQARGAEVEQVVVYQRRCPETDPNALLPFLESKQPKIIVGTSAQCVSNLMQLAGQQQARVLATPLLVVSDRVKREALHLGQFTEVVVAQQVSVPAILDALRKWYSVR